MKKYFPILMLIMSCTVTRNTVETYQVTDVKKVANNNSVVKLKGLQGWFELPSDTLKKNDVIQAVWIHKTTR